MTTYRNPVPTVDIIIELEQGIVLIERKNPPPGWALPGGFVELPGRVTGVKGATICRNLKQEQSCRQLRRMPSSRGSRAARLRLRLKSSIPLQSSASWKRPLASFSSINGPWRNRNRNGSCSWP